MTHGFPAERSPRDLLRSTPPPPRRRGGGGGTLTGERAEPAATMRALCRARPSLVDRCAPAQHARPVAPSESSESCGTIRVTQDG